MNRRLLLKLLSFIPFCGVAVPASASDKNALPTDPAARLALVKNMFEQTAERIVPVAEQRPYEPLLVALPKVDRMAEFDDGYTFHHHMIVGEGDTAIEAIDDWCLKLPEGHFSAIIWRVEPELVSDKMFDRREVRWRVYSRFATVPFKVAKGPTPQEAAAQIIEALAPIPAGFYVVPEGENVLIGSSELAFCVTPKQIEDGVAVDIAKKTFPMLLSAIEQYHSNI
jgi:hypothetical protein